MITWSFLLRYSAQILAIALGAAVLVRVLRVRDAGLRVRVWQAALLLCVALPWVQPSAPVVTIPAQRVVAVVDAASDSARRVLPGPAPFWIAGASVLLVRLLAGALVLRTLRRSSIAHGSRFRVSNRVTSPVAFGWLRPVILLPEAALRIPSEVREPMLEHETEHLRRMDWPQIVLEEVCRILLWFHPAVWWMLAKVRADREEAVDAAVAARVGSGLYAESLLAVAEWKARPRQAFLATTMFRGHSLERRLQSLQKIKENTMTKIHRAGALALLASAALTMLVISTSALPVRGFPQESKGPIRLDSDKLTQIKKVTPVYPEMAKKAGVQGTVVLDVQIGKDGKVSNITLQTGHPLLTQSSMEAVQQWEYEPVLLNGQPVEVRTEIDVVYTLTQ